MTENRKRAEFSMTREDNVFYAKRNLVDSIWKEANLETGTDDALEALDSLVAGKRLKDISDLPLDLCV